MRPHWSHRTTVSASWWRMRSSSVAGSVRWQPLQRPLTRRAAPTPPCVARNRSYWESRSSGIPATAAELSHRGLDGRQLLLDLAQPSLLGEGLAPVAESVGRAVVLLYDEQILQHGHGQPNL